MDIHRYKYTKYKNKNNNNNNGGGIGMALKALSVAKKGAKAVKKASDTARKNALKVAVEVKKEVAKEDMKELLGEDYDELNKTLDSIIKILNITSLEKLYKSKDEIIPLVNKLNELIQETSLDEETKKQIDQVVSFLNMITSESE
jgi:hypothetical protein